MTPNTGITIPKKGFTLIELTIVMTIAAILASAVAPVVIRSFQIKAGEKTSLEMAVIQEAARAYYIDQNQWPADIAVLQSSGYLSSLWTANNPWNKAYTLNVTGPMLTVSTEVPQEWTKLVASALPSAVIQGEQVSSTISSPGVSPAKDSRIVVGWPGSLSELPEGWQLCDGTNNTPDLRDKFLVGAGIKYDVNNIGGSLKHSHNGSTLGHALSTGEMPSHYHAGFGEHFGDAWEFGTTGSPNHLGPSGADWDNYYFNTSRAGGDQEHRHGITEDQNLPPFHALYYICAK